MKGRKDLKKKLADFRIIKNTMKKVKGKSHEKNIQSLKYNHWTQQSAEQT